MEIEQTHIGDTKALVPAIESSQERDLGPLQVLADSLDGSNENVQLAKVK